MLGKVVEKVEQHALAGELSSKSSRDTTRMAIPDPLTTWFPQLAAWSGRADEKSGEAGSAFSIVELQGCQGGEDTFFRYHIAHRL